jgi:hypothetical protein
VANTRVNSDDMAVDDAFDDVADDCAELLAWLMTWRVNPVQLQEFRRRRRVWSMRRVGACGQTWRRRVLARTGMQDVGCSPGFHQ